MLQFKIPSCDLMKATLKYLGGIAGPSGYGSKTTAEQVTQICSVSFTSQLTAIITEEFQFHRMEQKSSVILVV
ncbi:hypothetical protein CQW23_31837 [Capsicum baccatum]|uniref:Uncharacterized protein n=1 Tax=Capsicum baccatum TaxID=33114 RepID=A0A2G2V6E7_CAPBA|nr:hypothetical protein CQW23_31837 [Capsicum baccatum]